jgi:hypothetical protein
VGKLGGLRGIHLFGRIHKKGGQMKYTKSIDTKAIETNLANEIARAVDWHYFNPAVVANVLSTDVPLYTQDRIMELVKWIIKYESRRFKTEWESGNTTEGLMLADALNDVLEALGK